ncbi:DoxX family protein [Mycolicibacterium sediminis]|uniref:Membrane protein n=1 Tax=Mycolicibacterium sediminis TaxID=1286180 RepID=A0A7I7QWA3_9MYCO|nr:DoxX family protein [Mycolicibacterium sediminis]BBY30594.1 membrane protein [Mycolicibacterium sediminis]
MNKLETKLSAVSPAILSVFRIVFGLLFTVHGTQKLFAWPVAAAGGGVVPITSWPYGIAGLIELVVGVLLLIGLVTRLAAFIGSGEMAFAYFTQHQPTALWPIENGGEAAVLFCFGLFLLVFTGGGTFALDAMRQRRVRTR